MLAVVGVVTVVSISAYCFMYVRKQGDGSGGGDASYAHMSHLSFNVRRPTTEWLNMGDWTNTDDFVTANEQLALRLINAAGVKAGEAILDVGCGCGDSLLLLLRDDRFRPRLLHGVTSMSKHADRARRRIDEFLAGQSGYTKDVEAKIFCRDAVHFCEEQYGKGQYDRILALDCAYHFDTRRRFLAAASKLLREGGTIALQDLIASHPYPDDPAEEFLLLSSTLPRPTCSSPSLSNTLKHAITLKLAGVPKANIISTDEYCDDIEALGLHCLRFEDVSHAVFPGFSTFLQQIGRGGEKAWRGGGLAQWYGLRSFGEVVEKWSRGGNDGMVRSVTVVLSNKSEQQKR